MRPVCLSRPMTFRCARTRCVVFVGGGADWLEWLGKSRFPGRSSSRRGLGRSVMKRKLDNARRMPDGRGSAPRRCGDIGQRVRFSNFREEVPPVRPEIPAPLRACDPRAIGDCPRRAGRTGGRILWRAGSQRETRMGGAQCHRASSLVTDQVKPCPAGGMIS